MNSKFILEFSGGKIQTEFPSTADGETTASSVIWESPRLSVAAPYEGRPVGSDRAICRTVSGLVQVKLLNEDILNTPTAQYPVVPIITAGLYGEYAGIIGAIDFQQYYLSDVTPQYSWIQDINESNGCLGFRFFNSYANLMPNIFIRVTIMRAPSLQRLLPSSALKIDALCSGVLIGGDPR